MFSDILWAFLRAEIFYLINYVRFCNYRGYIVTFPQLVGEGNLEWRKKWGRKCKLWLGPFPILQISLSKVLKVVNRIINLLVTH